MILKIIDKIYVMLRILDIILEKKDSPIQHKGTVVWEESMRETEEKLVVREEHSGKRKDSLWVHDPKQ